MSTGGCGHDTQFDGVSSAFKRALWIVIAINGAMFFVEMWSGAFAGSKALPASVGMYAEEKLANVLGVSVSIYLLPIKFSRKPREALLDRDSESLLMVNVMTRREQTIWKDREKIGTKGKIGGPSLKTASQ